MKIRRLIHFFAFISITVGLVACEENVQKYPENKPGIDVSNEESTGEGSNDKSQEPENSKDNQDKIDEKIHDDEDPKKVRNEKLSLFISNYHENFNELTTYDKHKNIDWDNMKMLTEAMSNEIKQFLNDKNSCPPSMKIDLERILQLAEISLRNYDSNPVVYIHRILHDLDVEYNNYEQSKFGFSNYDGGGANQLTVSNYIEEKLKEDTMDVE